MTSQFPTGMVTLVFTDIEGSTRLLERTGARYGDLLATHRRLLRAAWAGHRGVEVDTQGDSFLVAFADAGDALAAVGAAQEALADAPWPSGAEVRVRMGVHTGHPQQWDEGYWGPDVHYGARLAAAAHGGQVLVSAATAAVVAGAPWPLVDLGAHGLKDFPAPRTLHQLAVRGTGPADFAPVRVLAAGRSRLPVPAADLVGREDDVRRVADLLGRAALVTLTGPGGSGKTRLALEVARELDAHGTEVWWVGLESVERPDDVPAGIARALGLSGAEDSPLPRVREFLAERRAVLVLDNLEHLLDAARLVGELARVSAEARVLVTSQASLRVSGEHVVPLGPLPTPHEGAPPEQVRASPAVRLLLERTAALGVPLDTSDARTPALARLARLLEGMPLALELAAARLRVLGPEELAAALVAGQDALGRGGRDLPPRQRGVQAVLEHTCGVLEPQERVLLGRLAAFAGDVAPALVESAFPGALDDLGVLVETGLVQRGRGGRLSLRPPVRRQAETLLDAAEAERARRRVVAAIADLGRPVERRWLIDGTPVRAVLAAERSNLLAALDWSATHDPDGHSDVVAAVGWWMVHSGHPQLARRHLDLALGRDLDPVTRARCLQARGVAGVDQADPTYGDLAVEAWAALGDLDGEVVSLTYAANVHDHAGDHAACIARCERALRRDAEGPPDRWRTWFVRMILATGLAGAGRLAEAQAIVDELGRSCDDDVWREFFVTTGRADLALAQGRPEDALPDYGRCIELCYAYGSVDGALLQACSVAECLAGLGRHDELAAALAACEQVHAELGSRSWVTMDRILDVARSAADPERVARARAGLVGRDVDDLLLGVARQVEAAAVSGR